MHIPHLSVIYHKNQYILYNSQQGDVTVYNNEDTIKSLLLSKPVIIANRNLYKDLLNTELPLAFDVLELLSFVRPVTKCSGSISSIKKHFNINFTYEEDMYVLDTLTSILLSELAKIHNSKKSILLGVMKFMKAAQWQWCDAVLDQISDAETANMDLIENLVDIPNEEVIPDLTEVKPINSHDIMNYNKLILDKKHSVRKEQLQYAQEVAKVFNFIPSKTNIALAEAGTGVGKTLGYITSIGAILQENPNARFLVSTYSRALQNQIYSTLERVFKGKKEKILLIKGVSNYICLLNYEHLYTQEINNKNNNYNYKLVLLSLIYIWTLETEYGDLDSTNFLPWLNDYNDFRYIKQIANKSEECLYTSCKYYKKCFVFKAKNRIKNSNIIVSNHSLSLLRKNFNTDFQIYDEAHHLFETMDNTFTSEISVISILKLRRWIVGNRLNNRSNYLNSLSSRVDAIVKKIDSNRDTLEEEQDLNHIISTRLSNLVKRAQDFIPQAIDMQKMDYQEHSTSIAKFIYKIYSIVLVNNVDTDQQYSLESSISNSYSDLPNIVIDILHDLSLLKRAGENLIEELNYKIAYLEKSEHISAINQLISSINSNLIDILSTYIGMLSELSQPKNDQYIYRYLIERTENKIINIGYLRHYTNPAKIFRQDCLAISKGCVFTSATLDESYNDLNKKFSSRSKEVLGIYDNDEGLNIVSEFSLPSPFNYAHNTKILIVNNLTSKQNNMSISSYIHNICVNSQGGVLILCTAIKRLLGIYDILVNQLKHNNINLLCSYKNNIPLSILLEDFKEDKNSCIIGSDALRDGIDIPGDSLRMVLLDKVPWMRGGIVTKSRVKVFGSIYRDAYTQSNLRQAYGRIIRGADDRGIMVVLDKMLPSKFYTAFPPGVEIIKVDIDECSNIVNKFFH